MKKTDVLNILVLIALASFIFYPLFYSEYLYTDEAVQLWRYKKGSGVHMSIPGGRYITDILSQWLFNNAYTIHDVIFIRLFSFLGWILCIPIWYFIIKKIESQEKLPLFAFFSILYLICTPAFSISIGWAACFELFIANTAGLISGYILYSSIRNKNGKIYISPLAIAGTTLFGIISLFTYQNGFGCFFLPFLLYLISTPKNYRTIFIGVAACLFIYVIYYFLFKLSLRINNIGGISRAEISVNVFPKVRFFFRPLATAFHFTYIFNEKSITGFLVYVIVFFGWLIVDTYQSPGLPFKNRLKLIALIILLLLLIYLPSLIVKENYFPNRTLLALDMGVFFLVMKTIFAIIKKFKIKFITVAVLSFFFVLNAWYNFHKQFLDPVRNEYKHVRAFIEKNYNSDIDTVYFIRPEEDFFVRKYHIARSWDEFGAPSTFRDWVPEFFMKQVVFEKTHSREIAEKLTINHWLGKQDFLHSNPHVSKNILVVDVEEIIDKKIDE